MNQFRHIYIHVPFCDVICHYCHFYTARTKEASQAEFFAALERELASWAPSLAPGLEAVYFGGGTPGASPPELIARFLDRLRPHLLPTTEITLETNPTNVLPGRPQAWREAGVNRISLGVQSLNDSVLRKVGRAHSAAQALAALELCLMEIPNVTADLLYGVPGQSAEEPGLHALEMVNLGAKHISAYHLSLEPEHFLHASLPPDTFAWDQIRGVADRLLPLGFHHYEVASFARPGYESRNNSNYWSGGPYLALGPSAHAFDGGSRRWRNLSDWREYIARLERGESPVSLTEELTPAQRQIEVIFTSLRTSRGLDLADFRRRFGVDLRESRRALFARWEEEGLGHLREDRFVLTFSGRMLCDEIAQRLL